MKKKTVSSSIKKLTAGLLTIGMVVTGMLVYPKDAKATVVEDKVIYIQSDEYDINNYWKDDSSKRTAPIKEGYVFGGWFRESDASTLGTEKEKGTDNYYAPLTEADLKTAVPDNAYAKFVPAQVLSVKAQNSAGIDKNTINDISKDNPMYVRLMSSLDSANYKKVGFDIYLGNWIHLENTETDKIYDGIMVGDNAVTAESIFGGVSDYVSVWQLSAIDTPGNAKLIIYVRPYWITTDGTKVEGLAKYVHIEDDYMGYVSIPVNILNKEDVAKVAAGKVNMTYTNSNANETVALKFKEVEAGRLLPGMDYSMTGENVIKMVGHGNTPYECNSTETLYANVRFEKPDNEETDVDVDFNINMVEFCDWQENLIAIQETWDVKYEAQ